MPAIKNYEAYLPLIKSVIQKSRHYYLSKNINIYRIMEYDDYCQEMYFVYEKCKKSFDANKANFKTYLTCQCRYKIQQMVRNNFGHIQTVLIEDDDIIESSQDYYTLDEGDFQNEKASIIMDFIKQDTCGDLLIDRFINKVSTEELVKKYGLNKHTINQRIKRFRKKMIEHFKED